MWLLVGAIIMLSVSCKKTETASPTPVVPNPSLTVSPDSLKFAIAGGSSTLTVAMNGTRWAAASDESWCTLSENSSTSASLQVTVTVTANPNMGDRTAKLTFAMDSKTVVYLNV